MAKQPRRSTSSLNRTASNRRGSAHKPSLYAGAIAIFILSLIAGIRFFGDYLYDYSENLNVKEIPEDALIVCLAGGKFRIEAAYSLYSQNVGNSLFIVGAGKRSTPAGLARAHASNVLPKISEDRFGRIHVETESRNTFENAFAVRRFLQSHPEIETIVLITSGYHMRRALIMIQNEVRSDIKIIPFTPPNEAIQRNNWWHTWLGIQVTAVEYFKFLLASVLVPRLGYF